MNPADSAAKTRPGRGRATRSTDGGAAPRRNSTTSTGPTGSAGSAGSAGLTEALRGLAGAAGERVVTAATGRMGATTERLVRYAERGGPTGAAAKAGAGRLAEGASPAKAGLAAGLAAVKERVRTALGRGGGAKEKLKVTNIVESIEVGVPRRVAYDQWTRFEDFPGS
ncbi:hypothetical protein [Plantactinospora veratri]